MRDVAALDRGDLADALLLHLIDAQHRVQRQPGALDPLKLAFYPLFTRVEHHGTAFAEHKFFYLYESKDISVVDLTGVHLVDLALIHEHDFENVTGCHRDRTIAC